MTFIFTQYPDPRYL